MTVMRWNCTACGERTTAGRPCPCGCVTSKAVEPAAKRPPFGQRRTQVKKVNKERKAKLRMAAFSDCARLARLLPCCVPSCRQPPPSDPAHVRSRGAGGKDRANVVSLCRFHHNQQGNLGVETFQSRHGLSLEVVAGKLAELVDAHDCLGFVGPDRTCLVCEKALPAEVTP